MLFFLVVEGLLLIASVALVHATPPDPLWIFGIYDGADQDDVVGMLVDDGLALPHGIRAGFKPIPTHAGLLNGLAGPVVIVSPRSTLRLRSPPSR